MSVTVKNLTKSQIISGKYGCHECHCGHGEKVIVQIVSNGFEKLFHCSSCVPKVLARDFPNILASLAQQ